MNLKPLIYEKYIEKNKCIQMDTNDQLDNELMYLHEVFHFNEINVSIIYIYIYIS